MPRLAHVFAPRDRVYFDLFEEAGRNIFTAADLLDRLLRSYHDRREELTRDILSVAGAALSKRAFARLKRRVDYTEMGGAPLLGMNGAAIICHGASPVKANKNAVRVAAEWVKNGVNEHIKTALEAEVELAEGREGGRE